MKSSALNLNKDWFVGLLVSLAIILLSETAPIQHIERLAYDWGIQLSSKIPDENIAIIAIDDNSISNLGRWPWPRDIHATMIDLLSQSGTRVIGHTAFFLEEQLDPGLAHIQDLIRYYDALAIPDVVRQINPPVIRDRLLNQLAGVELRLHAAQAALNTDAILATSISDAGNVVLPMLFLVGQQLDNNHKLLSEHVTRHAIRNLSADQGDAVKEESYPVSAYEAIPLIDALAKEAAGIGHLAVTLDLDGRVRFEPLMLDYYGSFYPSLAVAIAAKQLDLSPEDMEVKLAEGLRLGDQIIRTNSMLQMNTFYYSGNGERTAFSVDSFHDVITGRISPEKYRGKIVLIGATASGVGDTLATPVDPVTPPVIALAHSVSSILNADFFIAPDWGPGVKLAAFVVMALYIMLAIPRMTALFAATLSGIIFLLLLGSQLLLMSTQSLWIEMMGPAMLLVLGHALISTRRFLATERGKQHADAESAESNRMLGLSFQGQGQLELAFEKFRKCPLDDGLIEILYNLALDYERRRQFSKAGAVYSHIARRDKDYRDIAKRREKAEAMENSIALGSTISSGPGSSLILDQESLEKPMLGRYIVEKELGKGAMGIVYQGRDPRIGRTVAIKTVALSQEFEADELEAVKQRFFRESESAGRLNHANIVTIYDAGEEQDLAFIAMEMLKGYELTAHTKSDNLLPVKQVLELIADAADALSYAHGNNVIHRDIKPANILYNPETKSIKITDFGIARIMDTSKTKTGTVLGTPSYMSPEQFSGKKVDGRADLFSLGVMLYQLLTGKLPFHGDSMAALMYNIVNEKHPDPRQLRADLPECINGILDKALLKDANDRYADGSEMARDLISCSQTLA